MPDLLNAAAAPLVWARRAYRLGRSVAADAWDGWDTYWADRINGPEDA